MTNPSTTDIEKNSIIRQAINDKWGINAFSEDVMQQLDDYESQIKQSLIQEIREKVKAKKKDYLWMAFDDETGDTSFHEKSTDAPFDSSGSSVQDAYNLSFDEVLSILEEYTK